MLLKSEHELLVKIVTSGVADQNSGFAVFRAVFQEPLIGSSSCLGIGIGDAFQRLIVKRAKVFPWGSDDLPSGFDLLIVLHFTDVETFFYRSNLRNEFFQRLRNNRKPFHVLVESCLTIISSQLFKGSRKVLLVLILEMFGGISAVNLAKMRVGLARFRTGLLRRFNHRETFLHGDVITMAIMNFPNGLDSGVSLGDCHAPQDQRHVVIIARVRLVLLIASGADWPHVFENVRTLRVMRNDMSTIPVSAVTILAATMNHSEIAARTVGALCIA